VKIVIVDDDRLVSSSLKMIVEADGGITAAGVGADGKEAVALYEQLRPDVLLMDIRMRGMTGLEAGEIIIGRHRGARILFLTTFDDDEYIIKALKIGAKGYLLKQNFECIVPSLKAVEAGQSVFDDDIVAKIPTLLDGGEPDLAQFGLCGKEPDIIRLIAQGLSNKEIAQGLYLSEGTVRNGISVILEKLSLRSRTQLAIFYYKNKGGV
jgi:Response regulator containing a CheY-like receiver domain and an HTH DNA-binding domain